MTGSLHCLNAIIGPLMVILCLSVPLAAQAKPSVSPAATTVSHRGGLPLPPRPGQPPPSISPGLLPPPPTPTNLPPPPPTLPTVHTTRPPPIPTTSGNIIKQWLNMSLLKANLKSLMRLGDSIDKFTCGGMARCGKQERWQSSFENGPKCFCDEYCQTFGDCCYDYEQSCLNQSLPSNTTEDHEQSSCKYQIPSRFYGVTIIKSCSPGKPSKSMVGKCNDPDKRDVLTLIPVLDLSSNKTYGNVFCASCSSKNDVALWGVKASCNRTLPADFEKNPESDRKKLVDFVRNNCLLKFNPPWNLRFHHRICIPRLHDIHYKPINDTREEEKLRELCKSYAFPMCAITPKGGFRWFRNPHCILLQGMTTFEDAHTTCSNNRPVLPALTIFFDFHQITTYSISSQGGNESERRQLVQRRMTCEENQGYDVFSGRCRVFYTKETSPFLRNNAHNGTNCTYIKIKESEYRLFDNESLFYANKVVPKKDYYKVNNTFYVCANLTKNYTIFQSRGMRNSLDEAGVLTHLTIVGLILSLIGLILLILTYFLLPELRNLPGKIILSLAMTMLAYIVLYFFINQSNRRFVCHMVGIGLHFCLLSMFAWMNVMAFDIHYTFTRKGQSGDRSTTSGFFSGAYLRYTLYAWLVPLFITVVSVSLEITHAYSMGYASGPYCFMNNIQAKIYTLFIPVGLILLYNIVALCHTLVNIRKVQRQATKVTNQKHQVDLPIVCVKMTSVMGVTWAIGLVAGFSPYLQYLHVILNSLQGLLIFISYVLNKRVLKMYRSYFNTIRGKRNSVSKRSTNISPTS